MELAELKRRRQSRSLSRTVWLMSLIALSRSEYKPTTSVEIQSGCSVIASVNLSRALWSYGRYHAVLIEALVTRSWGMLLRFSGFVVYVIKTLALSAA